MELEQREVGSHVLSDATDGELVDGIAAGCTASFGAMHDRYAVLMRSVAKRRLGFEDLADDVVQDVLCRLWHQPSAFDPGRGTLRTYLLVQTSSRAIDLLRSTGARRGREGAACLVPSAPGACDDQALASIDAATVRRALRRLDDPARIAIELAFFCGLSYREVAEALDEPEGTIKSRIRRGLQQLHLALADPRRIERAS